MYRKLSTEMLCEIFTLSVLIYSEDWLTANWMNLLWRHLYIRDTIIVKLSGSGILEVLALLHLKHNLSIVDLWKVFGFGAKQTYTQKNEKVSFMVFKNSYQAGTSIMKIGETNNIYLIRRYFVKCALLVSLWRSKLSLLEPKKKENSPISTGNS
jgi:hypothetical protein